MRPDPLSAVIEDGVLDCGAADGVCDLGQRPGESRPAWLDRLRARFAERVPMGKYTSHQPSMRTWNAADWEHLLRKIAEGRLA